MKSGRPHIGYVRKARPADSGGVTQLNWIPKRAGLWSVAAASAGRSTRHEVHDHSAEFIAGVLLEEVAGVADGRVAEGPSAGEELL